MPFLGGEQGFAIKRKERKGTKKAKTKTKTKINK